MNARIRNFLFFISIVMNQLNAYIILFDLGRTLVDVNKLAYAYYEIGLMDLVLNGLINGGNFNPQKRMFETLERLGGSQSDVMHEKGVLLPKIYCDWMAGAFDDAHSTRQWILTQVDGLHMQGFFNSEVEYRVIYNAIQAMFSPEKLVKYQQAIWPMIALLERIDKKAHKVVAVTNWDQHSYPLFLASAVGQELQKHIHADDMIVSGYIKHNKPSRYFYQAIFEKYGDNPAQYIFVDDNPCNILAAQECGITSFLFTGNEVSIEKEFKNRSILKP